MLVGKTLTDGEVTVHLGEWLGPYLLVRNRKGNRIATVSLDKEALVGFLMRCGWNGACWGLIEPRPSPS